MIEKKLTERLVRETLRVELTNGNDGRGHKFFRSAKVREQIETYLRAEGLVREPFAFPVRLKITRVLGKGQRLWDADSILRGNSKELVDALVAVGWFADDGPKHIVEAIGMQHDGMREQGPCVIVEVWKA